MKFNNYLLMLAIFAGTLLLFPTSFLLAQPGMIDPLFSTGAGFAYETGKNPSVYAIAVQRDGKVVVGGQFVSFNGKECKYIARLNNDGTLDESFNSGSGFNNPVRTLSIQPDGKIIVGGQFTSYNGSEQNHIIRLNSDGTKDESFNVGSSFNDIVYATVVQPDGKIIAGGKFTNFNGTWQNNVARLNTDGTIDLVFYPEKGLNDIVFALALQEDGKVLAGGVFTVFNGNPVNHLIRLNSDGKADISFNSGAGFDNEVRAISVDGDNKIIAGGYFTTYNGKTSNHIVRINSNGSIDESFKSGSGFNGSVLAISVLTDNRIIAGGFYTTYNGTERKNLARLNADGTLDVSFVTGKGANAGVMAIHVKNTITIAGSFSVYNDFPANQVCMLISDPYIISVSPSSTVCASGTLDVEFSSEGIFGEVNIFSIELSDAKGSFSNPVAIGSLNATSGGSISAKIPTGATSGSGYRIRLVASNPPVKSKPNDADIKINALATPSIAIGASPSAPICEGTELKFTATPVNGGSSPEFQWKKNGNNVGSNSPSFSDYTLNNGDVITCILTSNADCPSLNNVTSNSIPAKVNPLLTPTLSISASPTGKVCEGTEVKFIALVNNGGSSPVFQWKKNGKVVGGNSVNYSDASLKNTDEITCTVKSNAECLAQKEVESNTIVMAVNPKLSPSVSILVQPTDSVCAKAEAWFTAEPLNAGHDPFYQWKKNGKNVGTNSARYSDNKWSNDDVITCVITSSAECFTDKQAGSNEINVKVKECNQ